MQIAILGGGLMGQAVSQRLINQQQTLTVYNRSPDKLTALRDLGAEITDNAEQAVADADIILLLLSDATAIEAVLASISGHLLRGNLLVQMGTISPQQSQQIADYCQQLNAGYLECPVLGSLPEARSGKLILMAGGEASDYQFALPVLKLLGENPQLIGPVGQGAAMKLAAPNTEMAEILKISRYDKLFEILDEA